MTDCEHYLEMADLAMTHACVCVQKRVSSVPVQIVSIRAQNKQLWKLIHSEISRNCTFDLAKTLKISVKLKTLVCKFGSNLWICNRMKPNRFQLAAPSESNVACKLLKLRSEIREKYVLMEKNKVRKIENTLIDLKMCFFVKRKLQKSILVLLNTQW